MNVDKFQRVWHGLAARDITDLDKLYNKSLPLLLEAASPEHAARYDPYSGMQEVVCACGWLSPLNMDKTSSWYEWMRHLDDVLSTESA